MSQLGLIGNSILTDIANAIRTQNGGTALYKVSEMAAAVLALDGEQEGEALSKAASEGGGIVDDACLSAIADAIRAQNGLAVTYTPAEMAPAILALERDVGLKPRAVLLADGTLEFNYLERRRAVTEGTVVTAYEVSTEGYSAASDRPWHGVRLTITRVVIDPSLAEAGCTNCDYWFNGFQAAREMSGFENLSGITSWSQAFTSCSELRTIYATSFESDGLTGTYPLYGCNKLVGGSGFVPSQTTAATALALGESGVLTDPDADSRTWFWGTLYADGELVVSMSDGVDATREVSIHDTACAEAAYTLPLGLPWGGSMKAFTRVTVAEDMAALARLNMCYWFYAATNVTGFSGLANLAGVMKMRYAFASCSGVEAIDLRGFDPSSLTDLFYAFASCSALTTIYADESWELPEGATGSQCFYGCKALVGGNGTAWTSSATSYAYCVIDREGQAGYLTAA